VDWWHRLEPARFFYENAIMGIELMETCSEYDVGKVFGSGTANASPKYTPINSDRPVRLMVGAGRTAAA